MNWLVTSVRTSQRGTRGSPNSAPRTTGGTAPQRWTNRSSAPPRKVSSYRKTTTQAPISTCVTIGRLRLERLSPSGITRGS